MIALKCRRVASMLALFVFCLIPWSSKSALADSDDLSMAEQLLNLAEERYPTLFPSHQLTQFASPFVYRHYAKTGIYLGVAVVAGGSFESNGVYLLGGAYGTSPAWLGKVRDYVGDVGKRAGNQCTDWDLQTREGFKATVALRTMANGENSVSRYETRVGTATTFQGQAAQEVIVTNLLPSSAGPGVIEQVNRRYVRRTGADELTEYGSVETVLTQVNGRTSSRTSTLVYSPPTLDRSNLMLPGEVETVTTTGTLTSLLSAAGTVDKTTTQPLRSIHTTSFVGIESINVPAGNFLACRFDVTFPEDALGTLSHWRLLGTAIEVKQISRRAGAVVSTVEATAVTIGE